MQKILVTGALGQIGTELVRELRWRFGLDNVVASSRRALPSEDDAGPFEQLDVTDPDSLHRVVACHDIDTIFHLAAILSAVGERDPQRAWAVNVEGLRNVLATAHELRVERVFWPSSIAAFGPETPRERTPQMTIMRPTTLYGINKVTGELLCDYYFHHHGLDVRGVRFPGVISSEAPPGGGTTDYAVEMFYEALRTGRYRCFVGEDTVLPMIYMPDCLKAAIDLMSTDICRLRHHNAFNLAAMSFSAGELAEEIRQHIPGFVCEFVPDYRQQIAASWPRSIDDTPARREWGWQPGFDLRATVADMLEKLRARQHAALI